MNILLTSVSRRVELFKEYGKRPQIAIDGREDGLVMLHYDDAIFVKNDEIQSIENSLSDRARSEREIIYL